MKASSETTKLLVTSSSNIAPHIEYCEKKGLDWSSVAKECELPIELMVNNQWLPTRDLMRFIHQLDVRFGPQIGFEIGLSATVEQLLPQLASELNDCNSLENALLRLSVTLSNLTSHVCIWTEYRDGKWWLCHRDNASRSHIKGFTQGEWFRMLAMIGFCRRYLGKDWLPDKAELVSGWRNPEVLPKSFQRTAIEYECQFGAFTVPLADDYQPIAFHQSELGWHNAIKRLVTAYAILPWFSVEWFADMIGMTTRTLQRNLKREGMTFKTLRDEARADHAKRLLTQTQLPIQEICWLVGYNDLSNFNRAFKGWTGVTAPMYRRTAVK
ncbi:helix-turn-helix domain-containing protein [Vibrio sp. WXL103]|uniref:helix-turn-helix domain-containing protein n=1 Tax=Vibrio sp. WXL103 TaxID=3450710 RepID=UPI003EC55482